MAQVPYFIWVSIATVLQLSITWMNWEVTIISPYSGECTFGIHLAHQGASTVASGDLRECSGDGGLADAALAGDPEQVEVEETWPTGGAQVQPPKPILRSPSAEPSST